MKNREYTKYYIAFLDILGFKKLVNDPKNSCEKILNIYESIYKYNDRLYTLPEDKYSPLKNILKMKIISDSMCFYIKEDIPNALHYLVMSCTAFQYNLLLIDPCIFLRGGISCGDMYIEDDIVFGPALIEAYLLQEKNAKVPRIIMCKNTLDHGTAKMDKRFKKPLINCVFRDEDAFYTLDYFSFLTGEVLQRVNMVISKELNTTTDESIRQKYLYVEKQIRQHSKEKTDV